MNKKLITEEQKDYQKELVANFRVFCDKLQPMVNIKKKHKRSRLATTCLIMSNFTTNILINLKNYLFQGQSIDQHSWNWRCSKFKAL